MQFHLPGDRVPPPLPPTRELRDAEFEQAELDGLMALHGQIHGHVPADLEHVLQVPQVAESFYDGHGAVFEEDLPVAGLQVACVHLAAGVLVRGEGGAAVEGNTAGDDDAVGFDDGFEVAEEGARGERDRHGGAADQVGEPEVGGLDEVLGFRLGGWRSHVRNVGGGQRARDDR